MNTGLGSGKHFYPPALRFSVTVIHAKEFRGEESGFVASGAGTDFEDDVLFVVGIFGQEQDFEFFFNSADAALESIQFFLRVCAHVWILFVGEESFAFRNPSFQIFELAVLFDDGRNFAMRFGGLLVFGGVIYDFGRGEGVRQFLVAGFDLVKALKHGIENRRWSLVVRRWLTPYKIFQATVLLRALMSPLNARPTASAFASR